MRFSCAQVGICSVDKGRAAVMYRARTVVIGLAAMMLLVGAFGFMPVPPSTPLHRQRAVAIAATKGHEGKHMLAGDTIVARGLRLVWGLMVPILVGSSPAFAADASRIGTKKDPQYQKCLSSCVYLCTKPKDATKTRQECLIDCKEECATTKEQRLMGVPKDGPKVTPTSGPKAGMEVYL